MTVVVSCLAICLFGVIVIKLSSLSIFNNNTVAVSSKSKDVNNKEIIEDVDMPPKITLNGEELIKIMDINNYQEQGVIAEDDKDGDITELVEINLVQNDENNFQVEYSVEDSARKFSYSN